MDGRAENFEGYSKQTRPLAVQGQLCELPKKLPADDLYVHQEVPAPPDPPERIHKTMCGQTLSSFPQYRRIKNLKMPRKNFCLTFKEGHTSKECVCVCRLLAASTHKRFLGRPSAGNDPCVRAFLLEVQQQRSKDLQTPLLPHHHLRTGYLRCQPCGKASEATQRRPAVEQPTVHPRGRYQRQARKNRSNHGHAC